MKTPGSTYRIQFHKDFRFGQALELLPFLERMGITDVYASPIMRARKGSQHGYDVTDPARVNPESGNEEEFERFAAELKQRNMAIVEEEVDADRTIRIRIHFRPKQELIRCCRGLVRRGHSSRATALYLTRGNRLEIPWPTHHRTGSAAAHSPRSLPPDCCACAA